MTTALAIAMIVLLVLGVTMVGAIVRRDRARPADSRSATMDAREAAIAAQIDVEEHDIGEMLDAKAERRRRLGKTSLGDELAEEIQRPGDADG